MLTQPAGVEAQFVGGTYERELVGDRRSMRATNALTFEQMIAGYPFDIAQH